MLFMEFFKRAWSSEKGEDITEYALIVGLVALAVIVGAMALGTNLNTWYEGLGSYVAGIGAPTL